MAARLFSIALTAAPFVLGGALALIGLGSSELLAGWVHWLAPDGVAETFPLPRIQQIQARLLLVAVLWLGIGLVVAWPRLRVPQRTLDFSAATLGSLRTARVELVRFARAEPLETALVAGLTALALVLSLLLIGQPIRCDEALTYFEFVKKPWYYIVASFELVNNHILHSLASHTTTRLLGDEAWATRLPALISGVATIPAGYAAVRAHFGKLTALLAAGIFSTWFWMVDLSTLARGYSMINLFFVLLLYLAPRLLGGGGRGAWGAFTLLCVLGVYTVPVMVFPLAVVFLWLAIGGLVDLPRAERLPFLTRVFAAGVVSVAVTLMLYSWTLVTSGRGNVVMARWVRPETPVSYFRMLDVFGNLGHLFETLWTHWSFGLPAPVAALLVACSGAALLLWRRPGHRLLVSAVAATLAMTLVLGKVPFFWTVPYLGVLGATAAAAGFVGLVRFATCGNERAATALIGGALLAIGALNVSILLGHRAEMDVPWYVGYHEAPEAAARLADTLDGAAIAGWGIHLLPLSYYLGQLGVHDVDQVLHTNADPGHDVLYFVDVDVVDVAQMLEELEAQGFERTAVVVSLPNSRILRLERR